MEYAISESRIRTYGLEIHAAEHCNLRCTGCAQSSPHLPRAFPDLDELSASLSRLERVLRPERATILGGEPLLNPELDKLLEVVRAASMFERVVVTTNGLLLPKVSKGFWELVDSVELSVYPSTKARIATVLDEILDHAWSSGTELQLLPTPQFRHIVLTSPIPEQSLVAFLYRRCHFRHYCHTLQNGRFYKCGPSTGIRQLLNSANGSCSLGDSGIPLDDSPQLRDRILEYLNASDPIEACTYCLGSSGSRYPHTQLAGLGRRHPDAVHFSPGKVEPSHWKAWLDTQGTT